MARLARRPRAFSALLAEAFFGLILGVFELTLLLGRQYSPESLLFPHGLPVLVFFHSSAFQRFRFFPALVFRTCPGIGAYGYVKTGGRRSKKGWDVFHHLLLTVLLPTLGDCLRSTSTWELKEWVVGVNTDW